jgi:hypothetical protein
MKALLEKAISNLPEKYILVNKKAFTFLKLILQTRAIPCHH